MESRHERARWLADRAGLRLRRFLHRAPPEARTRSHQPRTSASPARARGRWISPSRWPQGAAAAARVARPDQPGHRDDGAGACAASTRNPARAAVSATTCAPTTPSRSRGERSPRSSRHSARAAARAWPPARARPSRARTSRDEQADVPDRGHAVGYAHAERTVARQRLSGRQPAGRVRP